MKRLWTPEDLETEPVVWIRAENQLPEYKDLVLNLYDENKKNQMTVVVDAGSIFLYSGEKTKDEKGCYWLSPKTLYGYVPYNASSSVVSYSRYYFINSDVLLRLLKSKDLNVFVLNKGTEKLTTGQQNVFSSGGNSVSRPMLLMSRSKNQVSVDSYFAANNTIHSLSYKTIENNYIGPLICYGKVSYVDKEVKIRINGEEGQESPSNSSMDSYDHYPLENSSNCYNATVGANGYFSFSEIIIVNQKINLDIVQKIEGYLAWKNNYVELLSNEHPYKDTPPEVEIPDSDKNTSLIAVPSNPVLFVNNINARIGDTRLAVGGIPFYNLDVPKDLYTGKSVSGTYKYYGTDKFITVPKDTSSMYISTLFVPDNQVKYGITPCQVLLRFN